MQRNPLLRPDGGVNCQPLPFRIDLQLRFAIINCCQNDNTNFDIAHIDLLSPCSKNAAQAAMCVKKSADSLICRDYILSAGEEIGFLREATIPALRTEQDCRTHELWQQCE